MILKTAINMIFTYKFKKAKQFNFEMYCIIFIGLYFISLYRA